jgi:hypothetical protein
MSNNIFTSLPTLITSLEDLDAHQITNLPPPIHAEFFVPKLENKPQNPIIDSLDLISSRRLHQIPPNGMVGVNSGPATVNGHAPQRTKPDPMPTNTLEDEKGDNIWMIAASGSDAHGVSHPFQECHRDPQFPSEQAEDVGWVEIYLRTGCYGRRPVIRAASICLRGCPGIVSEPSGSVNFF